MSILSKAFGLDKAKNKKLRNAINALLKLQFTDEMRAVSAAFRAEAIKNGLTESQANAAWEALMKALKVQA